MILFFVVGWVNNDMRGWGFNGEFWSAIDLFRSYQNSVYERVTFYRINLREVSIELLGEWKP